MEKKFVFEGQTKKSETVGLLGLSELQTVLRHLDGEPFIWFPDRNVQIHLSMPLHCVQVVLRGGNVSQGSDEASLARLVDLSRPVTAGAQNLGGGLDTTL